MHESDQSTQFWYPVPTRDINEPLSIRRPEPYLFTRTQRAFLYPEALKEDMYYRPIATMRPNREGRVIQQADCLP